MALRLQTAAASPTDRDVLLALYNATDGANWIHKDNWGTDADLSRWYGVIANGAGRVVELSLTSKNLRGKLPASLGQLGNLKKLHLSWNQLSGHTPKELGALGKLATPDLSNNQLTGPIPKELGALSRLEHLWLQNNKLTGEIPASLGQLSSLQKLNLNRNKLSGAIPAQLGALKSLASFNLSSNQLSDVIFDEVKARFGALDGRYSFSDLSTDPNRENVLVQMMSNLTMAVGRIEGGIQESLMRLKNLQAPNYPYPHLVVVKEIETPGKRGCLTKICGIAVKDMRLHFLCPVDMSKVPCGVDGEGYHFGEARGWVKKLSPVLQVAVVSAKVALKATAGLDVDISEFLKAVKDGLVEEVADRTLDEEALFRVVSGEEDADADMQRDTRDSYEALKKFMDKEKLNRRKNAKEGDGYIDFREKMQPESDGKGGTVWVRTENVQKWRDSLSTSAPLR